jgi:acetyl-CoA carboxylase carboxyl transferase subunit beta
MAWFRKPKTRLQAADRRDLPGELWEKCPSCGEIVYKEKLRENWNVCPNCGHHLRLGADGYVQLLTDEGTFREGDRELRSGDPLGFVDLKPYRDRLAAAERKSAYGDAVVTGEGELDGIPLSLGVMDFSFIGGSMGSVVGEKLARAGLRALEARTPYILTDPTTGGVTASYAMLGDVNLAEPGALIGFAGPRVIEQTIKQELPEGFQRAEFLLEYGMLDDIVDRRKMKGRVSQLLRHMLGLPASDAFRASEAA